MSEPEVERVAQAFPPGPVGPFEEVLHALVMRDPEAVRVHQLAPLIAVVGLPEDERLAVLIRFVPGLEDRLRGLLEEVVGWSKDARLEVAVFGGGPEVRGMIEVATPTLTLSRLRAYHLGSDGLPWSSGEVGPEWPLWARLVESAEGRGRAPLDWAPFREKVTRDRDELDAKKREVSAFASRLQQRTPRMTYALLAVIVLLYGLEELLGGASAGPLLYRIGALFPERVWAGGEWWRVVSYGFLHFGVAHALMNAYVLFALGPLLEQLLGARRFLILWTVSLVGGGLAALYFTPRGVTMGASGALWGLLGAEAILAYRPRGLLPESMVPRMRKAAMTNLGMNVLVSLLPNVSMPAHFGGGLTGALLVLSGLLTYRVRRLDEPDTAPPPPAPVWLTPLTAGCVALCLAGMGTALWMGRPWELIARPEFTRVQVPELGFALEVPTLIAEHREVAEVHVELGQLDEDPLQLRAMFEPADRVRTEEELRADLEAEKAQLGKTPKNGRIVRGPEEVKVEGRPGVQVRYTFGDGAVVDVVSVLRPEGTARVTADMWPQYADRWAGTAWRGAGSLEPLPR